jgi:hypothetical protein
VELEESIIASQLLGKHNLVATIAQEVTEKLLDAVFSMQSV